MVDPTNGPTTLPCTVAMLTVPSGSKFSGRLNARGKLQTGEWVVRNLEFSEKGGVAAQGVNAPRDPKLQVDAGPGH